MPLLTEPVAAILKRETAQLHRAAEEALLPKLTSIRTLADYSAILKTFYGFFAPLQQKIEQHISIADLPDMSERRQASLALKDLGFLHAPVNNIPLCTALPGITNVAEAFGALYVLEGSTLGGQMIGKMLLKNKAAEINEDHLHFFFGYREKTGMKWKTFLEALNKQTDIDSVIASANHTFSLFQNWINSSLYHTHAN